MGQKETARQIWDYLRGKGWTPESVAAVLGNMQSESGIIADRWQSDIVGNMNGGYGLVQWTPASKYINWAKNSGLDYKDVISQCKRILWEVDTNQQFIHKTMTFRQFTQSRKTPEELADIFIRNYERPKNPNQPARQVQARYWYDFFINEKSVEIPSAVNNGVTQMQCIYWIPSSTGTHEVAHYFNGVSQKTIPDPDTLSLLRNIYRDNNQKEIPEYHWINAAPWWIRLESVCVKQ